MSAMSDYLENKIIDWLLRQQAFTPPTDVYIALFTTNDNDANSAEVEVTGGSYARVHIVCGLTAFAGTQSAASTTASTGTGGTTSNNAQLNFPSPTANWGSITGWGMYDAATVGNLLFYTALTTPKTVNNGDPAPYFAAAALTVQIDN